MSKKLLLIFLAGLLVALNDAPIAGARADDDVLLATGKEVQTAALDPGTVACLGGELTGLPFPPCNSDTQRIRIRASVSEFEYQELAGDAAPMMQGINTVVGNCNLNNKYRGRCWGTFEWEIPGMNGSWEGTFTGVFDFLNFTAEYTAVGHGTGGELEGLKLKLEAVYPGGVPYGYFTARVRD